MGKICTKCGVYKIYTFYYKNNKTKDGYRSECKECSDISNKAYKPKNIIYIKTKICNICCKRKKTIEFRKNCKSNTGISNICKACLKYKESNKNKINVKYKVCSKCNKKLEVKYFNKSYKNKDGYDNRCKKCLSDYYKANKIKIMSRVNKWRKDNPIRAKINYSNYVNRRRARKLLLDENFSVEDRISTLKLFDYKCINCGSDCKLTVDHFRPLSKGFTLNSNNAIVLCVSCNSSKHDLDPEDFFIPSKFKQILFILSSQTDRHQ